VAVDDPVPPAEDDQPAEADDFEDFGGLTPFEYILACLPTW
jgi:hypothetical protein